MHNIDNIHIREKDEKIIQLVDSFFEVAEKEKMTPDEIQMIIDVGVFFIKNHRKVLKKAVEKNNIDNEIYTNHIKAQFDYVKKNMKSKLLVD